MLKPTISLNKFCEYGRSPNAKRRRDILKGQKFPDKGGSYPQYYSLIRKDIIQYICLQDTNTITKTIKQRPFFSMVKE